MTDISNREPDLSELEVRDLITTFKAQLSAEQQVDFDRLMAATRSQIQKAINSQANAVTEDQGLLKKLTKFALAPLHFQNFIVPKTFAYT